MPTPRGLSQAPTSFIGSWCLDIHRLPLVACQNHYKDARVHYAVLKIRAGSPIRTHRVPSRGWSFDANRSRPYVRAGLSAGAAMSMRFWPSGPIPQDPTARLGISLENLHVPRRSSTGFDSLVRYLMVNVPHSKAPSPRDICSRNDEWTLIRRRVPKCSLERR